MYAIIESGGKQFKVREHARVRVPTIQGEVGERVTFGRVLCASDGESLRVGSPLLEGVRVVGEIVRHGRGRKIVVFKMKRRHRYRRKTGHRQGFTEVAIRELALGDGDRESDRSRRGSDPAPEPEIGTSEEPETSGRQVGPYVCDECGRGFATERGLQQHRGKAHASGA